MTEKEWRKCSDATVMIEYLRDKASERKLRFFKAACCRCIWHLLTDARSQRAIEAVEAFADGAIPAGEFDAASQAATAAFYDLNRTLREHGTSRSLQARLFAANSACFAMADSYSRYRLDAYSYAAATTESIGDAVGHSTEHISRYTGRKAEILKSHAAILRDIFGNPFRPVTASPTWATWNGRSVEKLAQAAYQERSLPDGHLDVARLGVLADALEDAGCDNEEILKHCREQGGVHVRGCWVVDLVLGKE